MIFHTVDRRLLPKRWREFEPELQGLHYPAQEVVYQILTAYAKGYSPEITNSLNERRKWLRRILSKLNRLKRNLSPINEDAVAGLCNSLREIHRPTPAPFSAGERIQLAISSGIDRCEYKRLCDQYLEERLAFPPKKHQ